MLSRHVVALASIGLSSVGCAELIKLAQHKTSGPNPLGGAALVNEWRQGMTPYVDCEPSSPPSNATLTATTEEVCVARG